MNRTVRWIVIAFLMCGASGLANTTARCRLEIVAARPTSGVQNLQAAGAPDVALINLRKESIIKGDQLGNSTPIALPISLTQFLVLMQRALCIPAQAHTGTGRWYSSSLQALTAAIAIQELDPYPENGWLISRQDAALLAYRLMIYARLAVPLTPSNPPIFADEAQIRPNARVAARSVVYAGLMNAEENWFHPLEPLKAGDAYVMAWNARLRWRAASQKSLDASCA